MLKRINLFLKNHGQSLIYFIEIDTEKKFNEAAFQYFLTSLVFLDIMLITYATFGLFKVNPWIYWFTILFDTIVSILLIIDLFYRHKRYQLEGKNTFFKENWIDFLGVIPVITFIPFIGPTSPYYILVRIFKILKIVSLLKNNFFKIFLFLKKTNLHYGLITIIFILTIGTCLFYYAEVPANPAIHNFPDALWFVIITITTVGYGDISPVTLDGRIIAVFLIVSGLIFFGYLTAKFSSWFIIEEEKEEKKQLENVTKLMTIQNNEIKNLKSEIEELKNIIKEKMD